MGRYLLTHNNDSECSFPVVGLEPNDTLFWVGLGHYSSLLLVKYAMA
jgi:hypothetical protein